MLRWAHKYRPGNIGDHEPVRWRDRWVEDRVRLPDIDDVIDAEPGMFEEMGGLVVDLERVSIVERIEIEQPGHRRHCITTGYKRLQRAAEAGEPSW